MISHKMTIQPPTRLKRRFFPVASIDKKDRQDIIIPNKYPITFLLVSKEAYVCCESARRGKWDHELRATKGNQSF